MDLHTWLDLPENRGKAAWLSQQLGRSKTAVSLWREDGVPLPLIPKISELTEGAVTEADMLKHALARKTAA
jgi:hypothetical protein